MADRSIRVLLIVLLVACTSGEASNIAFQLRINVPAHPAPQWVPLPYTYQPVDAYPNLEVDAEDLVQDLQPIDLPRPCGLSANTCAVKEVWRWDPTTGEYEIWVGGSGSGVPFLLEPGQSYGLLVQEVSGQTSYVFDLVGAHDPTYEHSVCWQPGAVNMRWISVPPHFTTDVSRGIPDVLDAEDLGQALGGRDRIVEIRRYDTTTSRFESWVVESVYGTPFPIQLNEAYAIDLTCPNLLGDCTECTWEWIPTHF
jgi:hypothetical protein